MKMRKDFLKEYGISEEEITAIGMTWEDFESIHKAFIKNSNAFEQAVDSVTNNLLRVNGVHSVRNRVKSPAHFLKKILRKKKENPDRNITLQNYETDITDLAGVRAIHLFKDDWPKIHDHIIETWDLYETPIAYFRAGDTEEYKRMFEEKGCSIK